MAIRKISEFVEASSPQNSDKLLIERNGSGKSITVGNLLNDVGMNVDLLWTNKSPTSGFSPQTLTFDVNLETYSYVCIVCKYLNTADIREVNFIKPDANYYTLHVTRSEIYWRYQTRGYSNIIEFGDGLIDGATNQNACIPLQIYGVK